MSYAQLKPNYKDIAFEDLRSVCGDILSNLGFKLSADNCTWLYGPATTVSCYYDSSGFRVIGKNPKWNSTDLEPDEFRKLMHDHLNYEFLVQMDADYYKFVQDFLCRVGYRVVFEAQPEGFVSDHFVPFRALASQIVSSITTRLGHLNFKNVYLKNESGEMIKV